MTRSKRKHRGPVLVGEPVDRARGPQRIVRGVGPYSIGDLSGEVAEPIEVTFTYFGRPIRVNPDMTEVDMIDFLDQAERVKPDDPKAMLMIKQAARAHIHPADFDAFWELRRVNRQGTQQLMTTIWQIIAGITNRPTGRPSDSSDGPPDTRKNSPANYSGQDSDQSDLIERYRRQIERFEGMGTPMGVAMAAQVATAAEARGISPADLSHTRTG